MKIVITGGAGFIGSHLAEFYHNRNEEVHIIDDFSSGRIENISHLSRAIIHKGSITQESILKKILENADIVFNFAAMVSVNESLASPKECNEININGLINLLHAASENSVKKLIHSSSAAVYGDDEEMPKTESMAASPKSPYGITKLCGEFYCKIFSDMRKIKTIALRYFNVFGPRQNPYSQYAAVIPVFIKRALEDQDIIIYGDGNQTRDFIYVDDIIAANLRAAENDEVKGVFNVANGKAVKILELAETIIQLTNSKSRIKFEQPRAGDIINSVAGIKNAEEALSFRPKVSLVEGLNNTIEYIKKQI